MSIFINESLTEQVRIVRKFPNFAATFVAHWKKNKKLLEFGNMAAHLDVLTKDDLSLFLLLMRQEFKKFAVFESGTYLRDTPVLSQLSSFYENYLKKRPLYNVDVCLVRNRSLCLQDADQYIKILAKMMPKLKKLVLDMHISGRYISRLKQLENLAVFPMTTDMQVHSYFIEKFCINLSNLRVLDIRHEVTTSVLIRHIDLPKLEILRLNADTAEFLIQPITRLPSLKKLVVRNDYHEAGWDSILPELLEQKWSTVTSLAIDSQYLGLPTCWEHWVKGRLPKLQHFTIENWNYTDPPLSGRYIPKQQLKTLTIKNWKLLSTHAMLNLIDRCSNLTHLNIEGCPISVDTLQRISDLRERKYSRVGPLQLWTGPDLLGSSIQNVNMYLESMPYIRLNSQYVPQYDDGCRSRGFAITF